MSHAGPEPDAAPAVSASEPSGAPPRERLPWPPADRAERITNACLAVVAALVLAVAVYLEPSAAGHGTHQQLGLPPCNFLEMTGLPCLSCGMTTSFSHTVRGQLLGGLAAQPFGTFLALCTVLAVPACLWSAIRGRSLAIPLGNLPWRWMGPGLLVFLLGAWVFKIVQLQLAGP